MYSPDPKGHTKLEISMYTMSKVAELYGVQCQNARLNYDDILALEVPFVTLINTHHYITVLSVTETEVTYYEHNLGENGDTVTISRQEFENTWQGNTITADPNVDQTKLLSAEEAKKIKGAFFGIIAFLIGYVINIVVAVAAIAIDIIIGVVGAIGGFLGNVFVGIAGVVGKIAAGLSFLGKAYLGTFGLGSAMELGGGWTLGLLVDGASTTLMNIGIGYGVSLGLEAMGVDPLISGIVASVITGGIHGFNTGVGGIVNAMHSAIQWGLAATVGVLGDVFDIDPMITSILSMTTFVLTGAAFDPGVTIGEALLEIAPNIAGELAYYGVQFAGQAMGFDPNLMMLAGIGIRSSLIAGMNSFFNGVAEVGSIVGRMLDAAIGGIGRGITKIGLDFLTATMGLDPLLANIGFSAIATGIEALIGGAGIFQHMFQTYGENALTMFGVIPTPDRMDAAYWQEYEGGYIFNDAMFTADMAQYYWQQAAYVAQIQDFTSIAVEEGFVEALNNYATGFFSSTAVNSMVNIAGSIGQYIWDKLDNNEVEQIDLGDGQIVDGVLIENTESILLFDAEGNIVGLKDGENLIFGEIGVDGQGNMGIMNGFIEYLFTDDISYVIEISDGMSGITRLKDGAETLLKVDSLEELSDGLDLDPGHYDGFIFEYDSYNRIMSIPSENMFELMMDFDTMFSNESKQILINDYGLTEEDIESYVMTISAIDNNYSINVSSEIQESREKLLENTLAVLDFAFSDFQSSPENTTGEKMLHCVIEGYKLSEDYDDQSPAYKLMLETLIANATEGD